MNLTDWTITIVGVVGATFFITALIFVNDLVGPYENNK